VKEGEGVEADCRGAEEQGGGNEEDEEGDEKEEEEAVREVTQTAVLWEVSFGKHSRVT